MMQWEIDTSKLRPREVGTAESALYWAEYRANLLAGNCEPGEMPAGLAERIQANPVLAMEAEYAGAMRLAYSAVETFARALQQYAPSDWAASEVVGELEDLLTRSDATDICPLSAVFNVLFGGPDMGAYHTALHPHVPSAGMRYSDEFREHVEWWVRAWVALAGAPEGVREGVLEALLEGSLGAAERVAGVSS